MINGFLKRVFENNICSLLFIYNVLVILFYICNLKKVLDNVIYMMLYFGLIFDF